MSHPPKIVISGITSLRNRGVESLVVCTVAEIRRRVPGAVFTVLDRAPDYDAARLPAPEVKFMMDGTLRRFHGGKARRLAAVLLPGLDHEYQKTRLEIAGADALVASGGDVFCSEYGHRSLLTHLEPLKVARKHGVPFFLHAHSIGPFTNDADRRAFLEIAPEAAGISVRESASRNYLTGALRFPAGKVGLAADPAFLLEPGDQLQGDRLFAHLRLREDRPTVALSVSQAICPWMGEDAARHEETWLELITWLREELDANVILIPHVQETWDGNNDLLPATALLRRSGWDPRIRIAGGDLRAVDFKAIISRCDFVIAERMHASIAALSAAVPALTVGYSVKAEGILTDLLGEELTRFGALIPLRDFLVPGTALSRVREAWRQRGELAAELARSLETARGRALDAFDRLSTQLSTRTRKPHA